MNESNRGSKVCAGGLTHQDNDGLVCGNFYVLRSSYSRFHFPRQPLLSRLTDSKRRATEEVLWKSAASFGKNDVDLEVSMR
jgi:hypothetical protein